MILELSHVYKKYNDVNVIDDFSLSMEARARLALFGASGCGKTTLLNMLLGFTIPDGGSLLSAEKLHYAVVFQEDRLLMPFDAMSNLDVYPSPFNKAEAVRILTLLGLFDVLQNKKPACEYSGGMKRRLAIARALYGCVLLRRTFPGEPLLLIMDEPFKGLDTALKAQVLKTTDEVINTTQAALLLVTHDTAEAAALGCGFIRP